MATKIEWDIFDYAARDVLSGLLDELGASYREMENLTQGEVTYSRTTRSVRMIPFGVLRTLRSRM